MTSVGRAGVAAGAASAGPAAGGAKRVALVLADDEGARASARALSAARPDLAVLCCSGGQLGSARWSHRVDASGRARTTLRLAGHTVADDDLALVWFRAPLRVPPALAGATPADQEYALAELHALVVSWLASLGERAVNRPDGDSASGPSSSAAVWRHRARQAGLAAADPAAATSARLVPGWQGSPDDVRRPWQAPTLVARRLLVAGSRVLTSCDDDEAARARDLARDTGCRLLEVLFDASGRVLAADPCPELDTPDRVSAAARALAEVAA